MGIAGAGYGAAKTLEQLVMERRLQQALTAEIENRNRALTEQNRSNVADEGMRSRGLDIQEQNLNEQRAERTRAQGEQRAVATLPLTKPGRIEPAQAQVLRGSPVTSSLLHDSMSLPENEGVGPLPEMETQRDELPEETQQRRTNERLEGTQRRLEDNTAADNARADDAARKLDEYRRARLGQGGQQRPITQTAESQLIDRISRQWTTANKPNRDLDRQVALMDEGMKAVRRGDLAQGAQAVLVTFQKILDPPSVVRESEYMRSAAGLALLDRVRGAWQQLSAGGAGVPAEQLEKFATLARDAAKAQRTGYAESVKRRLGKVAERYQIPEELVFEEDDTPETLPDSGGSTPEQKPIPGVPGGMAELRNGKWIRVK